MNQSEIQNDHGTITSKLSQFLIILTFDLVSTSCSQFMATENGPRKPQMNMQLQQVLKTCSAVSSAQPSSFEPLSS